MWSRFWHTCITFFPGDSWFSLTKRNVWPVISNHDQQVFFLFCFWNSLKIYLSNCNFYRTACTAFPVADVRLLNCSPILRPVSQPIWVVLTRRSPCSVTYSTIGQNDWVGSGLRSTASVMSRLVNVTERFWSVSLTAWPSWTTKKLCSLTKPLGGCTLFTFLLHFFCLFPPLSCAKQYRLLINIVMIYCTLLCQQITGQTVKVWMWILSSLAIKVSHPFIDSGRHSTFMERVEVSLSYIIYGTYVLCCKKYIMSYHIKSIKQWISIYLGDYCTCVCVCHLE